MDKPEEPFVHLQKKAPTLDARASSTFARREGEGRETITTAFSRSAG
jgi:hypothetical protein